ncbi:MAG: GatB/YqeY domain-containing protein [Patescibacteria group bacterium]
MQLKEQLENDLSMALKTRDELIVSVLRMLKAAWQNLGIELRVQGKELSEEDILSLLKKEIKKRQESIELYIQGKRQDLADKEKKELEILSKYLPEEMSDENLREILEKIISEVGDDVKNNFGLLMKKVMEELKGKADGSRIGKIIKEILS